MIRCRRGQAEAAHHPAADHMVRVDPVNTLKLDLFTFVALFTHQGERANPTPRLLALATGRVNKLTYIGYLDSETT